MGEPSRASSLHELKALVKHKFPGAQLITDEAGNHLLLTVHGLGKTEYEAHANAIAEWDRMCVCGASVRSMLDEILQDLRSPGMSRARHDSIQESLDIVSSGINDGILTGVIPFVQIAGLNREVEDLRRRVSARLGMQAASMADFVNAKAHAQAPVESLAAQNDWNTLKHLIK